MRCSPPSAPPCLALAAVLAVLFAAAAPPAALSQQGSDPTGALQVPAERFLERQPSVTVDEFRPGPRRDLGQAERSSALRSLWDLARLYAKAGQIPSLVAVYDQILAVDPDDQNALLNQGAALGALDGDHTARRLELNRRLLTLAPQNPHAWYNLGNVLEEQGAVDEAVAAYERALQIDPKHFMTVNNLGLIHHMRGNLDEAEARYRLILQHMPEAPDPNFNLALVLIARGKLDDAVRSIQTGLKMRPDSWQAHSILGYAHSKQGKAEEAAAALRRALTLNDDAATRILLARILFQQSQPTEASRLLREALDRGLVDDLTRLYERKLRGATARLSEALGGLAREFPEDVTTVRAPGAAVGAASTASPQATTPIALGVLVSLEPDAEVPGLDVVQAATLAVEKANRAGGVNGRPLKLFFGNSAGRGPTYVEEVRRLLIREGVVALIDAAVEERQAVQDGRFWVEGIPWLVPAYVATEAVASPRANTSWLLFDAVPSALFADQVVADVRARLGKSQLLVLFEDQPQHRRLAEALGSAGPAGGLKVVPAAVEMAGGAFLGQISERLRDLADPAVVVLGSPRAGAAVLRALRAERPSGLPVYLGADLLAPAFFEAAGPASDGARFCVPPYARGGQGGPSFADAFKTMFKRFPAPAAASAYDLAALLTMVMRRVGPDRVRIQENLAKTGALSGTCGARRRNGPALAIQQLEFLTVEGGRLVAVPAP